jgi:hypothetical protein
MSVDSTRCGNAWYGSLSASSEQRPRRRSENPGRTPDIGRGSIFSANLPRAQHPKHRSSSFGSFPAFFKQTKQFSPLFVESTVQNDYFGAADSEICFFHVELQHTS